MENGVITTLRVITYKAWIVDPLMFSHKTSGCQGLATCCQSSPLLDDPSDHLKYAAVEIRVQPIVWQLCTDVSSFCARGLWWAKSPLL